MVLLMSAGAAAAAALAASTSHSAQSIQTFLVKPHTNTDLGRNSVHRAGALQEPCSLLLSPLDSITPPVFTRFVYFWPPDRAGSLRDTAQLRHSLALLLQHYPHLAGRLHTRTDGTLEVKMRPKSDAAPLVIATAAAVTYAVLSTSNFSPDSFPQSPSFFPRIRNAAPFAAQVTHLADGGAAVALRISHQLCDGRACFAVAAAWGQLHRGLNLAPPPQHDRAVLQAIAAVTRPPDACECYGIAPPFQAAYAGATAEASEWEGRMLSFSAAELGSIKAAATAALTSNTPPSSGTSSLINKASLVNNEALLNSTASLVNDTVLGSDTISLLNSCATLRSTAPPPSSTAAAHVDTLCEDAKQHSSAAWISTLDALNGHLWCAVMRARRAAGLIPADALQQPHAVSRLWFTVDGRRRFKLKKGGASLPVGFSGNVYMFSCAEQPLAQLAPAPPSAAVAAGAAAMCAAHGAGAASATAAAAAAAATNDAPAGRVAAPASAAGTSDTAAAACAAPAAAAAADIRNAVDRADPAACLAWVSAQSDQSRVFLKGLVPTPTSFLSTDWRFADAYAIDFGEGQPAKLRRAPMPGRIMACVLPAPPGEGGVEVYLGLRKAVWAALDADAQFHRPPR